MIRLQTKLAAAAEETDALRAEKAALASSWAEANTAAQQAREALGYDRSRPTLTGTTVHVFLGYVVDLELFLQCRASFAL